MTPPRGVLAWDNPFIFKGEFRIWLAGGFMAKANCPQQWDPENQTVIAPTHGGTHIAQRWISGTKAPLDMSPRKFTINAKIWDAEDCYKLMECQSRGVVDFSTGVRCVDVFQAVTGNSYLLRRRLADGVVTGVTSVTHPTEVLLDGAVDALAATVSGQTMTALKTGRITVRYTPVHYVKLAAGFSLPQPNDMETSIVLEEAIDGDFA